MKISEMNTWQIERSIGYIPKLRPNATIEELDDWVIAIGGREVSAEELDEMVRSVNWSNVPGENPKDPDFPFANTV